MTSHMTMLPTAIRRTRNKAGGDHVLRTWSDVPRWAPELARDALEHVGRHVEVRVHGVHVVEVLERVDELHQLRRALLVERDERLGPLGDLGVLDRDPGLVERGAHRREGA